MNGQYVKNYTLYRVTMTNANTEYSQALSGRSLFIRIHSEDLTSSFRFSFTAAASGTGEVIFAGSEWFTPGALVLGDKTIYIQSPNAGAIVQIVTFDGS